jgi:hypothetical protein
MNICIQNPITNSPNIPENTGSQSNYKGRNFFENRKNSLECCCERGLRTSHNGQKCYHKCDVCSENVFIKNSESYSSSYSNSPPNDQKNINPNYENLTFSSSHESESDEL